MLTDAVSVAARYVSSDCAMRIYELLDTHPPARRYGERGDGMRIILGQSKISNGLEENF